MKKFNTDKFYRKRSGKMGKRDLLTAAELRELIKKFRAASIPTYEYTLWQRIKNWMRGSGFGKYYYVRIQHPDWKLP